ncbi:MAG: nucleotide pyrophosphatase/phosphodiesterase family protein [Lentisphaeria bacterium]
MQKRVLSLECAGLGLEVLAACPDFGKLSGFTFSGLTSVFPAVTCTAQATFRTGLPPAQHQVVCNGRYDRKAHKVDFWNQSAGLVQGKRIWDALRQAGGKAGVLFHQQSLGDSSDLVVSPAPVHRHHGGMIQACHCCPPELEDRLKACIGKPFTLMNYWGPLSNQKSSAWICAAAVNIMQQDQADFLAVYLPHLDYCQQKIGPQQTGIMGRELQVLAKLLRQLLCAADELGYEVLVWGDYGIRPVHQVVYPNRILRQYGLFQARRVAGGQTYPNLHDSAAFAMVDHQVAHLFVKDPCELETVRKLFSGLPGVDRVLPPAAFGLPVEESGELVLEATPDAWFAYPWWESAAEAPDYATHVDIHNKIGFDPCELFWRVPFLSTSLDCTLPRGSHGRLDCLAAVAATPELAERLKTENLLQLSVSLEKVLGGLRG